jgi:hypothetical protein
MQSNQALFHDLGYEEVKIITKSYLQSLLPILNTKRCRIVHAQFRSTTKDSHVFYVTFTGKFLVRYRIESNSDLRCQLTRNVLLTTSQLNRTVSRYRVTRVGSQRLMVVFMIVD